MDFTLYLPVTTVAAALNGLLLIFMTLSIALRRRRDSISYGDGGDAAFAKRQRGHANATEQIPIGLILILLAEVQGASYPLLWTAAALLTLGRVFHALQFWFRPAPFLLRPIGVVLTLIGQFITIVWLLRAIY
jgi:uncharacterized membrane protein YecN with MAPEG domain